MSAANRKNISITTVMPIALENRVFPPHIVVVLTNIVVTIMSERDLHFGWLGYRYNCAECS